MAMDFEGTGRMWHNGGSVWHNLNCSETENSVYLCTRNTANAPIGTADKGLGSPVIRPKADFYVRRDIARCLFSYSECFR